MPELSKYLPAVAWCFRGSSCEVKFYWPEQSECFRSEIRYGRFRNNGCKAARGPAAANDYRAEFERLAEIATAATKKLMASLHNGNGAAPAPLSWAP